METAKYLHRLGMFLTALLIIYMCSHRPSEAEFYSWLLDKYHIECHDSITCTKVDEGHSYTTMIETGSNIKNGYLLFNTIGKIYEDEHGTRTTVKAMGMFGKYFTIIVDEQEK
ncbi:hypothetical protein [Bacillus sp. KH172YL63]|uniref:hypothetical protein n=1 Tax=Bacillus sp. KH172YL63 TaxID=2709784 RepID=UPI0013E4C182|nr:hypothetical protein [Bacillus sp. KH172YL63]BCB04285.1 hypothetical protein KH172YL63_24180 [Bacillus sp. KH172YL63]